MGSCASRNRETIYVETDHGSERELRLTSRMDSQPLQTDQENIYDFGSSPLSPLRNLGTRGARKEGGRYIKKEFDTRISLYENILKMPRMQSVEDIKFISERLKKHFVFSNLDESQILTKIVPKMFYCETKAETIFNQGDQASSFFLIAEGSLDVIINGASRKVLSKGDMFGEYALLYNAPRSATLKVLGPVYLWGLDRFTFRKAIEELRTREAKENRELIEKTAILELMTPEQKDQLAINLITQSFEAGATIINEGDQASSFYLIKEGSVEVWKCGNQIGEHGKNEYFGEQALYYNEVRNHGITARERTILLGIAGSTFVKIMGSHMKDLVYQNIIKRAINSNEHLTNLSTVQKEKLMKMFTTVENTEAKVAIPKGQNITRLKILLRGNLVGKDSGKVYVNHDTVFGIKLLLNEEESFDEDIVFDVDDGVVASITKEEFEQTFGKLGDLLQKNIEFENRMNASQKEAVEKVKQEASDVSLDSLIFIATLGEGQFGSVFLVQSTVNQTLYAIKCISRTQAQEDNLEKQLLEEKKVLQRVVHPFILQFIRTFKDSQYYYFLLEFVDGMELFNVIREIGALSTFDAQFYVGSMLLALEYLHTNGIIYRDLKPENVMINKNGYVKLIDMGTAKVLSAPGDRTFTTLGTPHYMAPEMMTAKGYTSAVDLWSVGVCLFEFMCGNLPFGEEFEDPMEIYQCILKTEELEFPGFFKDKKAKSLINQLLDKVPEQRSGGSYAALKAHTWFDGFDWDKLIERKMKVPFHPLDTYLVPNDLIDKMKVSGVPLLEEIRKTAVPSKHQDNLSDSPNHESAPWDKDF